MPQASTSKCPDEMSTKRPQQPQMFVDKKFTSERVLRSEFEGISW
jgi:hypothetical protein